MRPVLLDRGLREGKHEGRASVPRRPLVHVVRTEKNPTLSRHQVQRAFVKVRKVPRQPFGWPKPRATAFTVYVLPLKGCNPGPVKRPISGRWLSTR